MEIVPIDTAPLRMMRGHLEMFCPVKPIIYKAMYRGYKKTITPFITSRCSPAAPSLLPQFCFCVKIEQGASGHRGLLQNEVVQICRQWPLQVTWWNGWFQAQKVDCRFPRQMRQLKSVQTAKKLVCLICWMVFENKLLLLGFGHMLIFYNTPSFFDSLLSKSVRVTGRCCTYRRINFDSVCRTSCSWMIQTLYATQAKLLCYENNKDEMTTKWALTSHK